MADLDTLTGQWTDALGRQGQIAGEYAAKVNAGQTLGQQQIKQGVADAQKRMAAQAAATGNPAAQRAAAFGAGNMASAAIGQGAALSAQEQQAAAMQQLQAAQSQAQGYQAANQWQQQRDESLRNFIGQMFGGAASTAGGAAMMLSDESRKTAIRHLEAGDADRALAALRGGPAQDGYQGAMDQFIDAHIRARGIRPESMSDADHEREAVRIMQQTPEGRAWKPGGNWSITDPRGRANIARFQQQDDQAEDIDRRLQALGDTTAGELRAAVPRYALGAPAPAPSPYRAPLGNLPPMRVDTSRVYAPPPGDASAASSPAMADATPLRVRARR